MIVPFLSLLTGACLCSLPQAVQEVINQVLEKLEESQVPVTDYALRSSGAAVIPECTSPSFRNRAEKVILYSLPLVDYVRSPELILEKENHLGNCWPFHGSQGHVLIKLSVPVIPRAVTMDHVSGPELHGDSMSSAPKDFAVYGVTEEKEEQFLGQFVFLAPLNPTQTFRLKNELSGFVNYILLQVLSNWGHPDYTCVYRFRVHGDPLSEEGKVPLRSDNKAP
ncbi:SUN domain-containing protein 3-like [Pezoporus flaviventris]|uniref:SUN domain-containing protein 3-like n=1 Tax=Pezoporus flaviventris TaxID=889875 RepID=UPI002AB3263B|nr:SUN domain-containing protein 3-like [Pezoporus flaviventris]